MAKRNIRKTDAETTSQPEARRRTTPADGTAPRPSRSRRKTEPAAPAVDAAAESPQELTSAVQTITTFTDARKIEIPHEHIAVRAYHIYLSRGARPGDQFADWITAERELREQAVSTR